MASELKLIEIFPLKMGAQKGIKILFLTMHLAVMDRSIKEGGLYHIFIFEQSVYSRGRSYRARTVNIKLYNYFSTEMRRSYIYCTLAILCNFRNSLCVIFANLAPNLPTFYPTIFD